jgi:hypothetical protein
LAFILEGSHEESWEKDEEGRSTERRRRVLWREIAKERVISNASLKASETSLGKERRFTGTFKWEISCISKRSSPPGALSMMSLKALATALPGIALPGISAKDDILGRRPLLTRGGIKGRELGKGHEGR